MPSPGTIGFECASNQVNMSATCLLAMSQQLASSAQCQPREQLQSSMCAVTVDPRMFLRRQGNVMMSASATGTISESKHPHRSVRGEDFHNRRTSLRGEELQGSTRAATTSHKRCYDHPGQELWGREFKTVIQFWDKCDIHWSSGTLWDEPCVAFGN